MNFDSISCDIVCSLMKTYEISFNSLADLDRQTSAFNEQNPMAKFDETQINRARARATEIDNDGDSVGRRITLRIDYTETPL